MNWKKRANKQYETRRNGEKLKNWKKKTQKRKKMDDTERSRKKQEET